MPKEVSPTTHVQDLTKLSNQAVLSVVTNISQPVLTIVDDHNKCTLVYLLKLKSDVSIVLQNFYAIIETQFNSKIKVIRIDNGREFNLK